MNNVKKIRMERSWTQTEVCAKAGITQAYLSQIENGKRSMSLVTAVKLANIFGVTLDELIRKSEG